MPTLDALASLYRDPLFLLFPVVTSLVSVGAFTLFAAPLTWLAWRDPPGLRRYRIQSRRPRPQELVGPSIGRWLLNNAVMFAVTAASWPILRRSGVHAGPLPAWYVVIGEVALFVYLDDFLFYWAHRLLHEGWLYKRIHSVHHRILTPWAVTGHYMHPVEYVLTGTLALLGPVLLSAHVVTIWVWIALRQWEAADGHSGYDLPWTPMRLFPFNDGAVHHDFHHAKVRGNYAGFLTHVDRVFGTEARGYAADRARRAAAGR